jgi:hypothetical protein
VSVFVNLRCRGTHHDLVGVDGVHLGEYHENPMRPQWRIVIVDEHGAEAFHSHSRETALRDLREYFKDDPRAPLGRAAAQAPLMKLIRIAL